MAQAVLVVFCIFLTVCSTQSQSTSMEDLYLQAYDRAIEESGIPPNETLIFDISSIEPQDTTFNCPPLPDSFIKVPAKSVHALSPYHIKVIGAVGDSITAGFGAKAKCLLNIKTEYRGISWSAGGDDDIRSYVTLPNIVRQFNPSVKGFSVKTGKSTTTNAHFNRAISGAVSDAIPDEVRDLIQMIKADESINIEEDWKLVTMWIGGNDLCAYCKDQDGRSAANYVNNIKKGLDILRQELPRTFVNLVQILDVTHLSKLKTGLFCDLLHLYVCPCVAQKKYWDVTSQASRDYNALLEDMVANTPEYHNSDSFTVVLQPFFKNCDIPLDANGNGDSSYFGLDCFHFTAKAHSEAARALWNNMMQRVGSKDDHVNWGGNDDFRCPTMDFPYFFTHQNSQSSFRAANTDPERNDVPVNNDASSEGTNLLGVLLGSAVGAVVVIMAIVVIALAVVYRRQHRTSSFRVRVGVSMDTEKTRLIFSDTH